jgi:hypothetical protein
METVAPRMNRIALAEELGLGHGRLENTDVIKIEPG